MAGWEAARQAGRMILNGLIVVGLLSFMAPRARANTTQSREVINIRNTGLSLKLYAEDHQGMLPEKLQDLAPDYIAADDGFFSGMMLIAPPNTLLKSMPPRTIILVTNRLYRNGALVVAYADSSTGALRPSVPPPDPFRPQAFQTFLISTAIGGWLAALFLWFKSRGKTVVPQPET